MCCGRNEDEATIVNGHAVHTNGSARPTVPIDASTRWFAYIAVGIVLVSMLVGLAWMAWFVYGLFRPHWPEH